MTEPKSFGLLMTSVVGFVIGMFLFLLDVRSSGEALQTLRLKFEPSTISETGFIITMISMGAAAWLFTARKRGRSGA
ncbi:MAG: hypothetical protein A2X67_01885 [Ignavibacteria bacterium GWA2_55_11]|nr:MAG: hypothetical protein A2X67_01885 [Ignavibacteria bacterium GWA2_55_11]OGU45207.1 MAG: hypothetical protein A2X68_01770 [Ignavibacteria bacterium GWC2_56_12]OGU72168.1 MAG: hypothetical protein A3G43_03865 [Ignavibacteria bacterium RIFCSPLOWO2_12_FULL_56_21]OGU72626.1 MAG: hypothetical protein A3H45_08565 [Ignavibacteria bacterium RIFCSPLOWO2_02_FULL_55_14]